LAAKLVNDNEDQNNFSRIIWIKLSQFSNFSVWGRGLLKLLDGTTIDEQSTDEDLINLLVSKLSQQRYLLVLDNFESLLRENRQWLDISYQKFLLEWLEYGKESVLLITGRERPEIPLNILRHCRWLDGLGGLSLAEGESLLRGLGIQGESSEIQVVVQRVDGHPLLLELIAGVLVEGNDSPSINDGVNRDLMELVRLHQGNQETSLEKILDWSLKRLDFRSQELLLNLSVYRQPFDTLSATAMLIEGEVDEKELRDLARKSLIQSKKEKGFWKFRFQPLVQEYLQDRARASSQIEIAHSRAISYYNSLSKKILLSIDDFAPYQEIFYHYCQVGKYAEAVSMMEDCDIFFEFQGYNYLRIKSYEFLLNNWTPVYSEQGIFSGFLAYLGKSYYQSGNIEKAFVYFQRSQQISRQVNDLQKEATAMHHLASIQGYTRNFNQAIENENTALKIAQETNDMNLEVMCWIGLGDLRYKLNSYKSSIECYKKSLEIAKSLTKDNEKALSLIGLGRCYLAQGNIDTSIEYFEESREIFLAINSQTGESIVLNHIGNAYFVSKQYQLAIDNYNLALVMLRQFENHLDEAIILACISQCYSHRGEYQEALRIGLESLKIMKETRNLRGEADMLAQIAEIYQSLNQYNKSIIFFNKGLKISEEIEIKDYQYMAIACLQIGNNLTRLNLDSEAHLSYKKAIELLPKSYKAQRYGRIQPAQKRRLDQLAFVINKKFDEHRKYVRGKSICEYIYPFIREEALIDIRSWSQHRIQSTTEYYKSWLSLSQDFGDRKGAAICLMYLGNIFFCVNQHKKALLHYTKSLSIQNEIKNTEGIFESHDSISLIYSELEQHEYLLDSYRKSLEYAQEVKDDWREAIYHYKIGATLEKVNSQLDAIESYKKACEIFQSTEEDEDWAELARDAIQRLKKVTSWNLQTTNLFLSLQRILKSLKSSY
jgi:tetratricopeptide (TPR) repeat protein